MKKKQVLALCLLTVLALCLLAGCGEKAIYEVLVTDGAGKPVPGVVIQFCSDTECVLGTTDETGLVSFDKAAGRYTVHVLKAPEGYAPDAAVYPAPTQPGRMTIVLR